MHSAEQSKTSALHSKSPTVQVEFGGQRVDVPKGGYYDCYRMNPNLDEVARDPAVGPDIDFFRKFPKTLVDSRVGRIYAPNFYYRTKSVQLVLLAPIDSLRSKLPAPLEPITALPGYGLVALTFYSYLVCDNDPYNEVSIAIIVRQPGKGSYSTTQLLSSIWNRTFYGYVLALPVDTEIARVRGVYGYQLPKWLAHINLEMDENNIKADVTAADGSPDLMLDVPLPALKTIPSQSSIGTNNAIGLSGGLSGLYWIRTICEFHGKRNAEAGAMAASLHIHVGQDAPTDSIIPYTFKSLADDFVSLAKQLGCLNTIVGGHDW
ncbi:hypothetical protein N7501_005809 [Penicillium viridicatum]|nr:hypothetical protein N7501_005809 [Penicillium viridicatum]